MFPGIIDVEWAPCDRTFYIETMPRKLDLGENPFARKRFSHGFDNSGGGDYQNVDYSGKRMMMCVCIKVQFGHIGFSRKNETRSCTSADNFGIL